MTETRTARARTDTAAETVWRWIHECGNARRRELVGKLVTDGFRIHGTAWMGPAWTGADLRGPDACRAWLLTLHRAFPDLTTTVDDLFCAGDRVVARITHRGSHRGPWLGLAPTGRAVEFSQTLICRTENGHIAEIWQELDGLGLLITLGGAPPMGTAGPGQALRWAAAAAARTALNRVPQDRPWPWRGTGWQSVPPFPGPLSGTGDPDGTDLAANEKALHRWIDECVNEQAVHICSEIFHETYLGHSPPHAEPEPLHGPEGYDRFIRGILTGFPDAHATIEDMVSAGDRVCCRVRMTGTHRGVYRDLTPTGRRFTMSQIVVCRMVDGKIAESWQEIDGAGLLLQLGYVPRPGSRPSAMLTWFLRLGASLAGAGRHSRAEGADRG
ncbi:ester cyclase [Streptomyces sp. NPDC005408]|uniref:ester cyclase n=1 Tax=Streptomyces sp. NPDC005408 TaxID=3155341 RepID=UPI0033A58740